MELALCCGTWLHQFRPRKATRQGPGALQTPPSTPTSIKHQPQHPNFNINPRDKKLSDLPGRWDQDTSLRSIAIPNEITARGCSGLSPFLEIEAGIRGYL